MIYSSALQHACPSCGVTYGLYYVPGFRFPMSCNACRSSKGLPPRETAAQISDRCNALIQDYFARNPDRAPETYKRQA